MHLAKKGESNLIKYILADVPACSAEWFRKKKEDLREAEQPVYEGHQDSLKLMCKDSEKQCDPANLDPDIFPAEMSDELMAKLAPCYITTREFDQYRLDAEYISKRL